MAIYYLWDEALRAAKNNRGETHWFAYMPELLSRLGVTGRPLAPEDAAGADFRDGDVLFTGPDALPDGVSAALARGLASGGLHLVGFATQGADTLFGVRTTGRRPQPGDDFTLSGYFRIRAQAQARWLPVPEDSPPLPVFAPVAAVRAEDAEVLGDIETDGETLPGLLAAGRTLYFAFDLCQTLWTSAMGRPVKGPGPFMPVSRIPDSRITPPDYNTRIAYGDYYLYILQSLLADLGQPMLHRLPPTAEGGVPDLLLYYGGDEDAVDPAVTRRACAIMSERGLPYHVNLMPDGEDMTYVLPREEYAALKAQGHEFGLHYNFVEPFDWSNRITEDNFRKQYDAYIAHFGEGCVSTVGHCLIQQGWADRSRILASMGIRGDNGRSAEIDPTDINAFNLYGFAFGTAFPFFPYDDAAHGNRKIDFTEGAFAYYEPRIGGKYTDGAEKMQSCLGGAAYFGRMINLFTHPHYVADNWNYDNTITLAALDESARYAAEKGWTVIHSTPDRVCRFWHDRDRSSVSAAADGSWRVDCAAEEGLIVRFPAAADETVRVTVDGTPAKAVCKTVDGRWWLLVPVRGLGGHDIRIGR